MTEGLPKPDINPVESVDAKSRKIQAVVDHLGAISHEQVLPLIDAQLAVDPKAGILHSIIPEAGIVTTDEGLDYHFHVARVLTATPNQPNYVNPHYHNIGEEPYHVLSGNNGEINIGIVKDGAVEWKDPRKVVAGDDIEVQEGEVHSLRNLGDTPLDFTFACPDAHLVDNNSEHPEGDRYFTKDLPQGLPPQYPK